MVIRICAVVAVVLFGLMAHADASDINKQDPWDPRHIDNLPPEVRHYIAGICKGSARAQHDFATYSPADKRWRINLEYLRCEGLDRFRQNDQCLDVDFVETGAHFHLANKQFRTCGF